MRRILIQGWRFLPHSYSLVNQFQILELLRRPEIHLSCQEAPYYLDHWQPVRGLLDLGSEKLLESLPGPPTDEPPEVTYRIAFPYDLKPSWTKRTVVFGTAEFGTLPRTSFWNGQSLAQALQDSDATIVTPSNWSREGFISSGADPDRVHVVPHGIDPAILRPPSREERNMLRAKAGLTDNFAFLNLGAISKNKGIVQLLRAFASVARRHSHARLILKGLNSFYSSDQQLGSALKQLTDAESEIIRPRVLFQGGMLSMEMIWQLYAMADAYVSPYSAEGFNLPVLEAAACGLPVICTAGGPTDDFVDPSFALPIDAKLAPGPEEGFVHFEIDMQSLERQMLRVIDHAKYCDAASAAAPSWVRERFTWGHAIDKLLRVLFPG
jgi:glycosyltransferase involved in cell wall biosynthesis